LPHKTQLEMGRILSDSNNGFQADSMESDSFCSLMDSDGGGFGSPDKEPSSDMLIDSVCSKSRITFEPLGSVQERWFWMLRTCQDRSLYHSERWLTLLRTVYGFSFRVAMLERNSAIAAAIIFARVRRPFTAWWVSLPFSDNCPPLAPQPGSQTLLLAELLRRYPHERFEIRGVRTPPPWRSVECFLTWSVDLSLGASSLYRLLASNFRRNIAKAQKSGVSVEHGNSSTLIARFHKLHWEGRHRLGLPCQPLRFFLTAREVFGSDVDIWLASHHGRDLATIFTIGDGEKLYYKWAARDVGDVNGAGHLLYWSIIEQCAGRFSVFELGRTDQRNAGLNRFKHESGGRRRPLPYAFFPYAPENPSSEILDEKKRLAAAIWRRLPGSLCKMIERYGYVYMS
jgi:hypothetical protein